ncbi:MAG: hypothetical protein R3F37_03425 [Candidatus Competibacteraceae bacterium]
MNGYSAAIARTTLTFSLPNMLFHVADQLLHHPFRFFHLIQQMMDIGFYQVVNALNDTGHGGLRKNIGLINIVHLWRNLNNVPFIVKCFSKRVAHASCVAQ